MYEVLPSSIPHLKQQNLQRNEAIPHDFLQRAMTSVPSCDFCAELNARVQPWEWRSHEKCHFRIMIITVSFSLSQEGVYLSVNPYRTNVENRVSS